ncbi:MAG: hypothetical protein ACLFP8_08160 [Alphaproteobacteria bacterium]
MIAKPQIKPDLFSAAAMLMLCICALTFPSSKGLAQFQEDNEVKSLGEILNPQTDEYDENLPPKDRANIYFAKCMDTPSLAFDTKEKETLCACTSAQITTLLNGTEFAQLYKDTTAGRDARMKVITYGITECMDYVIGQKVFNDCMVSPLLNTIRIGKKYICNCARKHYEDIMRKSAPYFFMEAIKHDPMTLNPLEHHFTTDGYYSTLKRYTENCRTKMLYERQNR